MSAVSQINSKVTMSCIDGVWETLEDNQQCRFRGKVRLSVSSIDYPMHPVQVIEEQLEWIIPTPTPYLFADPVQVIKITSSDEDSKKGDHKRKAVDTISDDKGKQPMDEPSKGRQEKAGKWCYHCGGDHLRKNCYVFRSIQSRSVEDGCYACRRKGHLAKNCWYAERLQQQPKPKPKCSKTG